MARRCSACEFGLSEVVDIATLGLTVLASAALLIAGLGKLVSPRAFSETISDLIGRPASMGSSLTLGLLEVAAGFAIAIGGLLAAVTLIGTGLGFGAVGVYAIARGQEIECRCFGALSGRSRIGWPQVLAIPFWIVLGVSVAAVQSRWPVLPLSVGTVALLQSCRVLLLRDESAGNRLATSSDRPYSQLVKVTK